MQSMTTSRSTPSIAIFVVVCAVFVMVSTDGARAWVLQTQYSGNSLEVVLGSDVTFKWQYSTTGSSVPRSMTWGLQASTLQGFIAVQQSGNLVTNTAPPKYKDRVSWTGDLSKKEISYRLSNVTKEDNVLYGLFVQFDLVTTVTDTVKLKVLVPAKFTNSPPLTRTINERDVLSVECAADGTPTANVTWVQILNSGSIIKSEGMGSSTLTVLNIQRPDGPSGKYTYECRAKNIPDIAAITSKTEVTVHYPPEGTTLTSSSNTVRQGDQVTFTCKVIDANPSVDQYKFYFKNRDTWILKKQNKDGIYKIDKVQGPDQGMYACVPNNTAGNGRNDSVMLTVNVSPTITKYPQDTILKENTRLQLTCEASGQPTPSITWIKDGKQVSVGKTLEIKNINRNKAGKYVCKADNSVKPAKTASALVKVEP